MNDLVAEARDARRFPGAAMAKLIRQNAGITQREMADALGVHRVTLARWEAGAPITAGKVRARYARLLLDLQQELAS